MELLSEFPEFEYTGGPEGHFIYVHLHQNRMFELVKSVKAHGGFFVHPHPKQVMISDNPLHYWFGDETGLEIFYEDYKSEGSRENYKLWCDLLAAGKRIFACAGEDGHGCARDTALTTIYSEEKSSAAYLSHVKCGDFICGAAGIRMCMGNTKMGGVRKFDGKKLIVSTGDFHKSVRNPEHTYRLDIFNDKGVIYSEKVSCEETMYFSFETDKNSKFYRAEIIDENQNLHIAIGNPIWNLLSLC